MPKGIDIGDLDAETLSRLGLKRPRKSKFLQDDVRRHAIRVLAAIADLTQSQRGRVLTHAARLNKV